MQFSSIWTIDSTLSGTTTPGQSGLRSNGKEGVLCIPQNSSITGTSPSDCLVSYSGHLLGGFTLWREAVGILYSPSRLGNNMLDWDIILSAFKQQLHYYFHSQTNTLRKGMKPLIPPAIGQIVPLQRWF